LFPSFSYSDNHLLVLEIENSKDVILHSLLFFSLISISVFSLILYTIGNSIRTVLKQKQLSQVQKDFVNNVTHELKTPIASISLAADALLNEKVLNDHRQIQFYAERIIRENHRIDEKIDKILLSSAAEEGNLKLNIVPTDLNDIITTALEQMQPVIEKSAAQIKLNLKANNTLVLVDEQHLLNVIINLVDNAIKYAKAIPEVEIFMQNASRFLILIVRDNGIGIHERDKKHIFKRFFRASTGDAQHTKGFGIGLSYVFNIIRAHDGSIEVQSTVNKGSSFIIKLPLLKHA
jgi:two-component system phosphate regulon sensor histidine kinase PhoR